MKNTTEQLKSKRFSEEIIEPEQKINSEFDSDKKWEMTQEFHAVQLDKQHIQLVEITTDNAVRIVIKNSKINTEYGMPVVTFKKIMDNATSASDLALQENNVDKV